MCVLEQGSNKCWSRRDVSGTDWRPRPNASAWGSWCLRGCLRGVEDPLPEGPDGRRRQTFGFEVGVEGLGLCGVVGGDGAAVGVAALPREGPGAGGFRRLGAYVDGEQPADGAEFPREGPGTGGEDGGEGAERDGSWMNSEEMQIV